MKKGGKGGGNTKTGSAYEQRVDFQTALKKIDGYRLEFEKNKAGVFVYFHDQLVARLFRKRNFYKFLEENGVDWKSIASSRLEPDEALLVIVRETLFIIEIKWQQRSGSTDEKLQTCDYKRKKYSRLVADLGLKVEFVYVLNDWFKHPRYRDTLDYVIASGCHYKFDEIPLSWLGLPYDNKTTSLKFS